MTNEETAAIVAELQFRLRRTLIVAGTLLAIVTVTAVSFLIASGHISDLRQIFTLITPAFSAALILVTQYRNGKTNLVAQEQVLRSTNGSLGGNIERVMTKIAQSPEFQQQAATHVANQIIEKAALMPMPGGRRRGDPPSER